MAKWNQRQKPVAVRPSGPQLCSSRHSWGAGRSDDGAGGSGEALTNQTPADDPPLPARAGTPAPVSSGRRTLLLPVLDVVFPWPRAAVPSRACVDQHAVQGALCSPLGSPCAPAAPSTL